MSAQGRSRDQRTRHTPPALLDDRPGWTIRGTDAFGRLACRALATIDFDGLEHLRGVEGPLLIVANHVSNADAPLIGSFLTPVLGRRIHWLGKAEALRWPFIGSMLVRNGVLFIQRGAADIEGFRAARRVLDEGHVLCIFPEGTRSPTGALQVAKEGTTILAQRTDSPIVPVGLVGTRRMWPRGRTLPRTGAHVTVSIGAPFRLEADSTGAPRKVAQAAATTLIMRRIAELLPPDQRGVYGEETPAPP